MFTRILNVYAFQITYLIHNNLLNILLTIYDVNASDMIVDVKEIEIISLDKVTDTMLLLEKNTLYFGKSFDSPMKKLIIVMNEYFLYQDLVMLKVAVVTVKSDNVEIFILLES